MPYLRSTRSPFPRRLDALVKLSLPITARNIAVSMDPVELDLGHVNRAKWFEENGEFGMPKIIWHHDDVAPQTALAQTPGDLPSDPFTLVGLCHVGELPFEVAFFSGCITCPSDSGIRGLSDFGTLGGEPWPSTFDKMTAWPLLHTRLWLHRLTSNE